MRNIRSSVSVLGEVVVGLRSIAKKLKDNKNAAAGAMLDGVESAKEGVDVYILGYKAVVSSLEATSSCIDRFLKVPQLRTMATSLVGNVVQDIGNRTNEFANLVEAISKDPEIEATVAKTRDDLRAAKKAVEGHMKKRARAEFDKKKGGKKKTARRAIFKVVKNAD